MDFYCHCCATWRKGEPARLPGRSRPLCQACLAKATATLATENTRAGGQRRNGYRQTAKAYRNGRLPPGVT